MSGFTLHSTLGTEFYGLLFARSDMSGTFLIEGERYNFTAQIAVETGWLLEPKPKTSIHVLCWAVLLALSIHLLVLSFQWKASAYLSVTKPVPARSMQINLIDAATSKTNSEPVLAVPENLSLDTVKESVEDPLPSRAVTLQEIAPAPTTILTVVPNLPAGTNAEEPIIAPATRTREIDAIFNPPLRDRLRSKSAMNPAPAVEQSAPGPAAYTDVYGSSIVNLDSGLCMKSGRSNLGQPPDWWFTACTGKKSASEKMMDRVNQDFMNRNNAIK